MTASAEVMRITENSTRAQLAEALGYQNFRAKREFPRMGTEDEPTPYDCRHRALNDLLTLMELAAE